MNEQTIFTAALARKNPDERLAFLNEACGQDAALRSQVEELLAAGEGAGSFLEHPPVGLDATVDASLSKRDTVDNELSGALPILEPCDKSDRIGKLGLYEIIEVVGQGGMGTVLRALDIKLSRIVAVKVMAPELAANPTAVKRFLREAISAAAVVHDHVVTIHAVDDQSRPPYLVMEFIEGQTLQQKIDREGALPLKQILRIGSQMAAGLAAAHKTGLIHRDVKPANILLENGVQRVKITDFGLARAADDVEMTKTGLIAGTPQYMSPEQAHGQQIDCRSDLFSLGSVLYTMCTGRGAFRAETTMGTLRRVCEDSPRPIQEVNAEIPDWLCATIDKLLAKRPEDRFQTAAEVADLLSQFLAHLQQPATMPLPAVATLPVAAAVVVPSPKDSYGSPRRTSSGVGVILPICLVVLAIPFLALVLLVGGFLYSSAGRKPNDQFGQHVNEYDDSTTKTLETSPRDAKDGWIPLFNGQDLTGWKAIPPQNWRVENGVIHGSGPDGFLVTHANDFEDFHLVAEYRINDKGDSGIHFRMPSPEKRQGTRWGYSVTGLEAEVSVRKATGYRSGAITVKDPDVRVLAPSSVPPHAASEWTRIEIVALKDHIQILLNGNLVTGYVDKERKFQRGHIALCSWEGNDIKTNVEFRKVEIRKPPKTASADGFVPLFNGQDLSGWRTIETEQWKVNNGILIGTGRGHLISERAYQDFHCRLKARFNSAAIGSLAFRGNSDIHGEVCLGDGQTPMKTGTLALYTKPRADYVAVWDHELVPPDTWFDLDLIVRGKHVVAKVNGTTTADKTLDGLLERGEISLNAYEPGTVVEFSNVEIKELPHDSANVSSANAEAPPAAVSPFDEKQAKTYQDVWAKHLGLPAEYKNSLGMTMRLIPPGEFSMGSSAEEQQTALVAMQRNVQVEAPDDEAEQKAHLDYLRPLVSAEGPVHRVTLTQAYYFGSTEVTFAQFEAFISDSHYVTSAEKGGGGLRWDEKGKKEKNGKWTWKNPGRTDYGKDYPALQVSWDDAVGFCRWLSDQEGLTYRLPTEAEWEYACRAGTETPWHSGANAAAVQEVAWGLFHAELMTKDYEIHPVAQRRPNAFGLFDMHGNAQEWCSDWYSKLAYAPEAIQNPTGPSQPELEKGRVVRGGAIFWPHDLRSAIRRRAVADYADNGLGLRVVMVGNPSHARAATAAGSQQKSEATK